MGVSAHGTPQPLHYLLSSLQKPRGRLPRRRSKEVRSQMPHIVEIKLGERVITLETGRLAKQAGGSVVVGCGDARVLVTATAAEEPREGIDFFPLTVDYREYYYAAG